MRAAQRKYRRPPEQAGKQVEEDILRAENHRRAEYRHRQILAVSRQHERLAFPLAALVVGEAVGVAAEGAHVQQPLYPRRAAGVHHFAWQLHVRALEMAPGFYFMEDADQIDDRIDALELPLERVRVVDVRPLPATRW